MFIKVKVFKVVTEAEHIFKIPNFDKEGVRRARDAMFTKLREGKLRFHATERQFIMESYSIHEADIGHRGVDELE